MALCLVVTGMNEEDLLHLSVAVPVILAEVHLVVNHPDGFCDHDGRMDVVAVFVVVAVIG